MIDDSVEEKHDPSAVSGVPADFKDHSPEYRFGHNSSGGIRESKQNPQALVALDNIQAALLSIRK